AEHAVGDGEKVRPVGFEGLHTQPPDSFRTVAGWPPAPVGSPGPAGAWRSRTKLAIPISGSRMRSGKVNAPDTDIFSSPMAVYWGVMGRSGVAPSARRTPCRRSW